jgi:hypothetical protein
MPCVVQVRDVGGRLLAVSRGGLEEQSTCRLVGRADSRVSYGLPGWAIGATSGSRFRATTLGRATMPLTVKEIT